MSRTFAIFQSRSLYFVDDGLQSTIKIANVLLGCLFLGECCLYHTFIEENCQSDSDII